MRARHPPLHPPSPSRGEGRAGGVEASDGLASGPPPLNLFSCLNEDMLAAMAASLSRVCVLGNAPALAFLLLFVVVGGQVKGDMSSRFRSGPGASRRPLPQLLGQPSGDRARGWGPQESPGPGEQEPAAVNPLKTDSRAITALTLEKVQAEAQAQVLASRVKCKGPSPSPFPWGPPWGDPGEEGARGLEPWWSEGGCVPCGEGACLGPGSQGPAALTNTLGGNLRPPSRVPDRRAQRWLAFAAGRA